MGPTAQTHGRPDGLRYDAGVVSRALFSVLLWAVALVVWAQPDVRVTYRLDNDWGSGFQGAFDLTNVGNQDAVNWRLNFDLDRSITQVWNASILSHSSPRYVFQPAPYNVTIPPGGTVGIGFIGGAGSGSPFPSNVSVTYDRGSGGGSPAKKLKGVAPWLTTRGSRIVHPSNGKEWRMTGVNWFGFETETMAPHGLWTRSMDSMLDQIARLKFNTLRVPYSNDILRPGAATSSINFVLNPRLAGKTPLEVLDELILGCQTRGIKVILDRHRPTKDSQSALWYSSAVSEEQWIRDWETLAKRYKQCQTVVGFDLHNEPHGPATWGDGNLLTDWRLAAERCGNRILAINPNVLIIVEGVEFAGGSNYWWGGNLAHAGTHPVRLSHPRQLVYSTHDYPTSVYNQPWFSDPSYPSNLVPLWRDRWGYLVEQDIAPVLVGEFGTFDTVPIDRTWFRTLAAYLRSIGASFTYWSWNPNSVDTGGILTDDWNTVHQGKVDVLKPLLWKLFPKRKTST